MWKENRVFYALSARLMCVFFSARARDFDRVTELQRHRYNARRQRKHTHPQRVIYYVRAV